MQIIHKSQQKPEFNQFVPRDPHYTEVSLDKIASMQQAIRKRGARNFDEWVDEDGIVYTTYDKYLTNQAAKFCRKYPANFCREVRPELATVQGTSISWNTEAVKILMHDSYLWRGIVRSIEDKILEWAHFDFEKFQFDPDVNQKKKEAVDMAITMFYTEYLNLKNNVKS